MSSIEERIQKHDRLAEKANKTIQRYTLLIKKHSDKLAFHQAARDKLKAKQEKKAN